MSLARDVITSIGAIILLCVIAIAMAEGLNFITSETWNDGICSICDEIFDLKGVSNGVKYYACPECGQEVIRY